jgi:hypothetical protein
MPVNVALVTAPASNAMPIPFGVNMHELATSAIRVGWVLNRVWIEVDPVEAKIGFETVDTAS